MEYHRPVPAPTFPWLLGSRSYTFLATARVCFILAMQVQAVSVGWLVYELTGDPLALGLVGLAEAVPALGLALFAGWIVDRGSPLATYRLALACSAASALLILCAVPFRAGWPPGAALGAIYLASVVTGVARAFIMPSQFALLPRVVARARLGKAIAWNSSLMQAAFLGGPPLGGALLAVVGAPRTFLVVVALVGVVLVATAGVTLLPGARRPAPSGDEPPLANLTLGVRYVWNRQVILAAMALDMFAVLFGGVTALLPVFARDVFAGGPVTLGVLRGALPCGSLLMGWWLIRHPVTRLTGRALLAAVLGFGACMIGFGLSGSLSLSLLLLAGAGACDCLSMVMRHTILQLSTPEALRGRVAAVNSMFIGSSNELGAFESGVAARLLGTRASVVFGGLMTLLVVAVTWRRAPRLRRLELSRL